MKRLALGGFLSVLVLSALLGGGMSFADQNDSRLPPLFQELKKQLTVVQAKLLEARIWSIWNSHGSEEIKKLMRRGVVEMGNGRFRSAKDLFERITRKDPGYAEGWNKLATVRYMMGEFEESIEDVDKTLDLEPRHFGALAGLGLNFEALGNPRAAMEAYKRALTVNPYLIKIRQRLEKLEENLPEDST